MDFHPISNKKEAFRNINETIFLYLEHQYIT